MKKTTLGLIVTCCILTGCDLPQHADKPPSYSCTPIDYDNGVWYFPCHQRSFGKALAKFAKGKEILSITGDGTAAHGVDQGYWVVVK